jgi:molybdenum cofactor cytidylyltransferase
MAQIDSAQPAALGFVQMISIVILAAGSGSRIGETKQVLPLGAKPVLQHVIDAATDAKVDEILLVLGHEADRVQGSVRLPDNARIVINLDHAEGMAVSLVAGLEAADPLSEAAIVLLGDQPGVTPEMVRTLAETYELSRMPVIQSRFRNADAGPVLIAATVWEDVFAIEGDEGTGVFVERNPDLVDEVQFDVDAPPDIDTAADYQQAREIYG